jgi:hypothetical protein
LERKRRKVQEFIVDDKTLLKVGSQYVGVWVAIEPIDKVILGIFISLKEQRLLLKDFLRI